MKKLALPLAAAALAGCPGAPLDSLGENYAAIVVASYEDSIAAATDMDAAIDGFLGAPDAAGLTAAKDAWLDAREPYLQTEVYRFYDGPIDALPDEVEGLLNAWPMDENYIDYVDGDLPGAFSGIVNDASVTIDADTLAGLNGEGGDGNVATGYHALEFLLWGQDMSATGPGERSFEDYTTLENADRRGDYLAVTSDLLITHLNQVADQWADGAAYRTEWDGLDGIDALERILTGMIVLSGFETGGERARAALLSGDQEDEHSCFSDNTHRDMVQDVVGVLNVWEGVYTRTDGSTVTGTGVYDVVAAQNQELADTVDARVRESVTLAEAIQAPFDQEIAPGNAAGNARVQAFVDSLFEQESVLFDVFTEFGLTIELEE